MKIRALSILAAVVLQLEPGSLGHAQVTPVRVTLLGGYHPTVSPDGAWVGFRYLGGGIGKIPATGGPFDTLTTGGLEPDWSRTADLIVFRAGSTLYTVNALTGEVGFIRSGGFDDDPAWSPLGNEIAVQGSQGIVIISYPDGAISEVPCIDPDGTGCQGEGPTWSPDAAWLAFENALEILKVPRLGGTAEVVVEGLRDLGMPSWSPDGKWIAFVMEDSTYGITGNLHIWVADARGMSFGVWQVTTGTAVDRRPTWSPDSRAIYFESTRSGRSEIWKVDFTPVTSIAEGATVSPSSFVLDQNYRNPFNPSTTIRYDLPKQGRVSLKVYDLLGREVEVLVDEVQEPGTYQTAWWPIGISTGIYFYRLTAGEFVETRKLMLVK